jgi:hypothetical protein
MLFPRIGLRSAGGCILGNLVRIRGCGRKLLNQSVVYIRKTSCLHFPDSLHAFVIAVLSVSDCRGVVEVRLG